MTELLSTLPQDIIDRACHLLEKANAYSSSIVTAESCTGGLLAALLTDLPDCSGIFERGFVTYSDASKIENLGVKRETLKQCGAVSRETAVEMAKGALEHSKADISVAITGFAGPGDPGDEEGLVHVAVANRAGVVCHGKWHHGKIGRAAVRVASIAHALELMNDLLNFSEQREA